MNNIFKKIIFASFLSLLSHEATFADENLFKCVVSKKTVIQDYPCNSSRRQHLLNNPKQPKPQPTYPSKTNGSITAESLKFSPPELFNIDIGSLNKTPNKETRKAVEEAQREARAEIDRLKLEASLNATEAAIAAEESSAAAKEAKQQARAEAEKTEKERIELEEYNHNLRYQIKLAKVKESNNTYFFYLLASLTCLVWFMVKKLKKQVSDKK